MERTPCTCYSGWAKTFKKCMTLGSSWKIVTLGPSCIRLWICVEIITHPLHSPYLEIPGSIISYIYGKNITNCHFRISKMQLDVGMELTFRLVHVIYKCICTDKPKDPCTKKVTKSLYFARYYPKYFDFTIFRV